MVYADGLVTFETCVFLQLSMGLKLTSGPINRIHRIFLQLTAQQQIS